jgi:ATP-binding protein involved in chromosome partitioning
LGYLCARSCGFSGMAYPHCPLHVSYRVAANCARWSSERYCLQSRMLWLFRPAYRPGTGDIQQNLLQELALSGAVLVVTPQDVAHLDAKKALQQYRKAEVPLLGAVENMSGFRCPHCAQPVEIFARVPDARAIWAVGVEKLGVVPLDPAVSRAGDRGCPVLLAQTDSPQALAFRHVAQRVVEKLHAPE